MTINPGSHAAATSSGLESMPTNSQPLSSNFFVRTPFISIDAFCQTQSGAPVILNVPSFCPNRSDAARQIQTLVLRTSYLFYIINKYLQSADGLREAGAGSSNPLTRTTIDILLSPLVPRSRVICRIAAPPVTRVPLTATVSQIETGYEIASKLPV